jgi:GTP-binding protein HflX
LTHTKDGHRYQVTELPPETAIVVHPDVAGQPASRTAEGALEEAVGLTSAINLDVRHAWVTPVRKVRPATLLGAGAVEDLKTHCDADEIDVVIIDTQLSPAQQRNLEREIGAKVIDRTGLILEIFGARARTSEGRLQAPGLTWSGSGAVPVLWAARANGRSKSTAA